MNIYFFGDSNTVENDAFQNLNCHIQYSAKTWLLSSFRNHFQNTEYLYAKNLPNSLVSGYTLVVYSLLWLKGILLTSQ